MSLTHRVSKQVIFAGLAAILASCASQGLPPLAGRAPLTAFSAAAPGAQATLVEGAFTAHFVKAYGETIAQNEPIVRRDPNSPAHVLIGLIGGATKTLDGAFYDIGDDEVVSALIVARQRGVRVRIVTDTDNMSDVAVTTGRPRVLRGTIQRLLDAGIPVVEDSRSAIMHHKFLVADGQSVWMGSTNVTTSSLYHHNNNALVIRNPQLAVNYSTEFERMFTQRVFGPNPARQIPFPMLKIGNATVRTFFSPRGGGSEAILDLLSHARKRIQFMAFSFTDKNLADMMIRKRKEGLRVEGVYDQCLAYGKYSTKRTLSDNGVYTRHDGNEALLHHKVMIVDDTVVTGSFNFSASADQSNNENMLIIDSPALAAIYAQEYDRIMNAAKVNHPPPNHCPGQDPVTPPASEDQP